MFSKSFYLKKKLFHEQIKVGFLLSFPLLLQLMSRWFQAGGWEDLGEGGWRCEATPQFSQSCCLFPWSHFTARPNPTGFISGVRCGETLNHKQTRTHAFCTLNVKSERWGGEQTRRPPSTLNMYNSMLTLVSFFLSIPLFLSSYCFFRCLIPLSPPVPRFLMHGLNSQQELKVPDEPLKQKMKEDTTTKILRTAEEPDQQKTPAGWWGGG